MKKFLFQKEKKGIASITIVMLLGFVSIITMTSIFTYNSWRWETLENNIKKDNFNNAVDGLSLMQYILLVKYRDLTPVELSVYDSYENANIGLRTTTNIGSIDLMGNCNTVEMPMDYMGLPIKRVTAYNQQNNFFNSKTCCTAGIFNNGTNNELYLEELLNTYSKENCKNMNWPNLKDSSESIITSKIIQ